MSPNPLNGYSRLSELRVNERRVETPTFFPVFKMPTELKFWKYLKRQHPPETVMVNACILASSEKREEAKRKGIHWLLRFDRIVASDSGGFSKLSSGWSQERIIEFQMEMGADVATTLDYPIDLSETWFDRERVKRSVLNAIEASKLLRRRKALLFASIHAGTTLEIQNSIKYLEKKGDFNGYAIGSLLSSQGQFFRAVNLVAAARRAAGDKHIHAYGLGGSALYLLAFFAGADSVDSQGFLHSAINKQYYVPGETSVCKPALKKYRELPCNCRICRNSTPSDILDRQKLAAHNLIVVEREVEKARECISEGIFEPFLKRRFANAPSLQRLLGYASRIAQNMIW